MKRCGFILIRKDNIGDLVCTTPAIRALRLKFPDARIGVLVNSYNAEVVRNNPDIDEIYVYEKAKHSGRSPLLSWMNTLGLLLRIRRAGYDTAVGFGSYSSTVDRYAFATGARRRIGYAGKNKRALYNVTVNEAEGPAHHVVKTFRLLEPLGITGPPGAMVLYPDPGEALKAKAFVRAAVSRTGRPLLAVAISARVKKHMWPVEKFMALVEKVTEAGLADVLVLWAPGSRDNPAYPGDDESAERIRARFKEKVLAYPTRELKSLIAALSVADYVVSLDTGSLHISAALKKPMVALMTEAGPVQWGPWGTRNIVVKGGKEVSGIGVEEVFAAISRLVSEPGREAL